MLADEDSQEQLELLAGLSAGYIAARDLVPAAERTFLIRVEAANDGLFRGADGSPG
jgi:hypothetical protein